jgi:hypothetical protein
MSSSNLRHNVLYKTSAEILQLHRYNTFSTEGNEARKVTNVCNGKSSRLKSRDLHSFTTAQYSLLILMTRSTRSQAANMQQLKKLACSVCCARQGRFSFVVLVKVRQVFLLVKIALCL